MRRLLALLVLTVVLASTGCVHHRHFCHRRWHHDACAPACCAPAPVFYGP